MKENFSNLSLHINASNSLAPYFSRPQPLLHTIILRRNALTDIKREKNWHFTGKENMMLKLQVILNAAEPLSKHSSKIQQESKKAPPGPPLKKRRIGVVSSERHGKGWKMPGPCTMWATCQCVAYARNYG